MISVCILAKNSADTIEKTLISTASFPEVIVIDNGSTDATQSICQRYENVKVHSLPFNGFGDLRNQAATLAAHEWILALDTDEVLSPLLVEEIHALSLDPQSVYSMSRKNYYRGKHIKGCGWHPDRVVRLYHRENTSYSSSQVHESVITHHLHVYPLRSPIFHTPFRSSSEFIAKMEHYSTLFAKQYAGKRSSSFSKALLHSLFAFFRSFILQKGFLLGLEGFEISLYNSNSTFYKYIKLIEENKKIDKL